MLAQDNPEWDHASNLFLNSCRQKFNFVRRRKIKNPTNASLLRVSCLPRITRNGIMCVLPICFVNLWKLKKPVNRICDFELYYQVRRLMDLQSRYSYFPFCNQELSNIFYQGITIKVKHLSTHKQAQYHQ